MIQLRTLGSGFSSLVVETPEGIVFRIARNQAAATRHAREAQLLHALAGRVPAPIPDPQWYACASEHFPFGAIGYPALPGKPLLPNCAALADGRRLASELAAFLLALHRFPIEEALVLGLPGPTTHEDTLAALRDVVLPPLRTALTRQEYRVIAQWWDSFLGDRSLRRYPPVLQHGDFWYENILVDETRQKLAGVIDFEQAAVGDPAQDFATLFYYGSPFVAHAVTSYQAAGGVLGESFGYRLRKRWEARDFDGLSYAIQQNDPDEFEDSIAKLRRGPILNPNADERIPAPNEPIVNRKS